MNGASATQFNPNNYTLERYRIGSTVKTLSFNWKVDPLSCKPHYWLKFVLKIKNLDTMIVTLNPAWATYHRIDAE